MATASESAWRCVWASRARGSSPPAAVAVQRLREEAERDREEGTERPEDPRPEHQRDERHAGGEPDGVAHELGLDERLDDDVDRGVADEHGQQPGGAVLEQTEDRRRHDPDHEPDVRDVVRDEREQAPQQRDGDRQQVQQAGVEHRHDQPEDRRDHEVTAGAVRERLQRRDHTAAALCHLVQPAREPGRVESQEEQQRHDEEQVRQDAEQPAQQVADEPHELARVHRTGEDVDLLGPDAESRQPLDGGVHDSAELVTVLRQQGGEPRHGQHQRQEQAEQHEVDGHDHGDRGQPPPHALALQPAAQRVHPDREHQGEEHRRGYRGDAPQARDRDRRRGEAKQDHQPAWQRCGGPLLLGHALPLGMRPPLRSGLVRSAS